MKTAKFAGRWRIFEMDAWDRDYFDMEVKAYISIEPRGTGVFQFGLVSGQIDWELVRVSEGERLEFTWEGNDECDPVSGSGWIHLNDRNSITGEIKIHQGDGSMFKARRTK